MPRLHRSPVRTSLLGRHFYLLASIGLLVLTAIGFRFFYLEGKAYPGRELAPPIRGLLIGHGVLMTLWMLFAVMQPLLVRLQRKRLHRVLGIVGALIALGVFLTGLRTGIEAARVAPPDLRLFGLLPKEFLTVPIGAILLFGGFVGAGVFWHRRPDWHRPLMLLASLVAVSAALGRMEWVNAWYAGTWLEQAFSAFLIMNLIGLGLLSLRSWSLRRLDQPFAAAWLVMVLVSLVFSLAARTPAWQKIADWMLG
jgi:hypothetical protein